MNSLKSILNACSIAVVGASSNPDKTGHIILRNIIEGGFEGAIYPVNPRAEPILGLICYPSLSEIQADIDVAVIAVPSRFVPDVVEEAGTKRIKGVVIISGGFSEIGNEEPEAEIINIAKRYNTRVIGPNCQGFNYTPNKLCASWPLIKAGGPIGIISQSGTIGATLEMWAENEGIGISSFVSLGNRCDINEIDLINYFTDDPSTNVISLYIEGVKDGQSFIKTVRSASDSKPIVVLKPGKTEKGRKAVQSHTHSIVGKDEIFKAVCRQTGITRAGDIVELYDFSKALGLLKKPKGNNLQIITSSGGCGIIGTDVAEENGINVKGLNENVKTKLSDVLPNTCVISNPLDLTGDTPAERYKQAVEIAAEDKDIDIFLLIFGDPILGAYEVVHELTQRVFQVIVVCYLGGGEIEKTEVRKMHEHGIPVFPTPERAVNALKILYRNKGSDKWQVR